MTILAYFKSILFYSCLLLTTRNHPNFIHNFPHQDHYYSSIVFYYPIYFYEIYSQFNVTVSRQTHHFSNHFLPKCYYLTISKVLNSRKIIMNLITFSSSFLHINVLYRYLHSSHLLNILHSLYCFYYFFNFIYFLLYLTSVMYFITNKNLYNLVLRNIQTI